MHRINKTISKPKFVVAYACHLSGVPLRNVLAEKHNCFDTYEEALNCYNRMLHWNDGSVTVLQIFDTFIFNPLKDRVEYFKYNNKWVFCDALTKFNYASEIYYDETGEPIIHINYTFK